jgi:hypothetical protein
MAGHVAIGDVGRGGNEIAGQSGHGIDADMGLKPKKQ